LLFSPSHFLIGIVKPKSNKTLFFALKLADLTWEID